VGPGDTLADVGFSDRCVFGRGSDVDHDRFERPEPEIIDRPTACVVEQRRVDTRPDHRGRSDREARLVVLCPSVGAILGQQPTPDLVGVERPFTGRPRLLDRIGGEVESHVDQVRAQARERELSGLTAVLGDARDLPEVEGGYDAVLVLGPLYHLTERVDRIRALSEAVCVAQPSGVIVAAGISRFASLIDGLKRRILGDPLFRSIVERDLEDGQHRNPDVAGHPELFTTAYFHLPSELRDEAITAGLTHTRMFAVEGPSWILENTGDLDNQLFAARAVESGPSLLAATSHFMVVGVTAEERHP